MPTTICKSQHQDNPNSYERLFQLGLTYIQQLSGKVWTDYNIHDPGITILEQVCFALTDIIYRSDFQTANYLADENGYIDFALQGMFSVEQILKPPPQQTEDYELWLEETIASLQKAWVQVNGTYPNAGLYHIHGLARRSYPIAHNQHNSHSALSQTKEIVAAINKAYHTVRAIGEDLQEIQLINESWVHLVATISIDDNIDDVNQLAATIYEHTDLCVQRSELGSEFAVLKESLLSISGVQQVQTLFFEHDSPRGSDNLEPNELPKHACLVLPETIADLRLSLLQQDHAVLLDVADIALQIDHNQHLHNKKELAAETRLSMPQGQWIDFAAYDSIQNLFPRNYHLAPWNPTHYTPQQQAERHQLRSYLLLFDQLMANFCQDLNGIQELFSTSLATPYSYQVQALSHKQFNEVDQHYPKNAKQKLQELQAQFEHYPQRKGRLFDYLIALYGEEFPEQLHRQVNPYFPADTLDWQLLKYKQQFIRNMVTMTSEKGLGDNLYQHDHMGGYSQRLALLLGLKNRRPENGGYNEGITQYLLNVVERENYEQSSSGKKAIFQLQKTVLSRLTAVPARTDQGKITQQQSRQIRSILVALDGQTIPDTLLQYGVDNNRYRIVHQTHKSEYQLFFHLQDNHWLYITRYIDKKKLIRFCHLLQQWLIQLNRETEGLYVVEPLLLRPNLEHPDPTKYANRVNIILPGFTARFHSPKFRMLAEAVIRDNSPAHLLVNVQWLDFYSFCEFESHYLAWREQKAQVLNHPSQTEQQQCDALAQRLYQFLQNSSAEDRELLV